MVDQTISIARRGRGKEAHNSQRLFFIQKELQLHTKFHYIEVAATSENYKITLCITKTTVKAKIVLHIGLHPTSRPKNPKKKISRKGKGKRNKTRVRTRKKKKRKSKRKGKEKEKEKEKEKKEEKGKEEKKKEEKTERAVLKFFFSTPPHPDTFPSTVPSSDVAREQHNSHKGGTREKHNSYKQKTIGTKRQLTISRQTSCNDDQTLTLHHARIPITPKKGRRFEA